MTTPVVTSVAHLRADGQWETCANPIYTQPTLCCDSRLHLTGATAASLNAMPLPVLLSLIEAVDPPSNVTGDGAKEWWNHKGDLHRDGDLPAGIAADGSLYWYRNGYPDRGYDRPAVMLANGTREWWQDGELHRDHGPAVIYNPGAKMYWLEGEQVDAAGNLLVQQDPN